MLAQTLLQNQLLAVGTVCEMKLLQPTLLDLSSPNWTSIGD